jgi:adenosylcobinamide-GDP ribazoletransferase
MRGPSRIAQWPGGAVARFLLACRFLTRLPIPGGRQVTPQDIGRATAAFPVVGAGVGAVAALAARLFFPALPALLSAVLVVGVLVVLTGALHLDGLADTCDGFGGGDAPEEILRIMREPTIGAFGTVALFMALAIKTTAIMALLESPDGIVRVLIVAGALSRWAPVALSFALPYARPSGGLGASVADHTGRMEIAVASVLAAGAALGLMGLRGAVLCGVVALITAAAGWLFRRRIGGITGDTLGAATECAEALTYIVALAL